MRWISAGHEALTIHGLRTWLRQFPPEAIVLAYNGRAGRWMTITGAEFSPGTNTLAVSTESAVETRATRALPAHACQHPACPETEDLEAYAVAPAAPRWYCAGHAAVYGFCYWCHSFFSPEAHEVDNESGLCADCRVQLAEILAQDSDEDAETAPAED